MRTLPQRFVFVFLAATLAPLAVTLWIANSLLKTSLSYSTTIELDELSKTLEGTARRLYQRERDVLRHNAGSGSMPFESFAATRQSRWPSEVAEFWRQGEPERFLVTGERGDTLQYLRRGPNEVRRWSRSLGDLRMEEVRGQIAKAQRLVEQATSRDLRRLFLYLFLLLAAVPWLAALAILIISARRISRPIDQLTSALRAMAAGDLSVRLTPRRKDELGAAMEAFNRMAEDLQQSRERLLYLARLESWQALARKTAHEVKNSLTPIRLTMEELAARHAADDQAFERQAAQIIADEVNSLERRVRAFSEFAAEPPVHVRPLNANSLIEERIAFLRNAHPEIDYQLRLQAQPANALADEDLVKAVLTNLLENAAEAAGPGGRVLAVSSNGGSSVAIEVHDSGPGLPAHAEASLFEPTISFKKGGMGLGLSIARRSALLCGGDIVPVRGELGGAAFRVLLPAQCPPAAS